MHSGRGGKDHSDKCASENMNMKMYCDPGAELFSSTLMPTATPLSLPKATPSSSLDAMVWNLAGDTRGKLLSSSYSTCSGVRMQAAANYINVWMS